MDQSSSVQSFQNDLSVQPKERNKYLDGKIYKITCDEIDKIYVGSTCGKLEARLRGHRSDHTNYLEGKGGYITSYEILKFPSAKISLIESFSCESKDDLLRREDEWIDYYKDIRVNKFRAYTGLNEKEYRKDYYQENKEYFTQKFKEYYESHREEQLQYKKDYYQENKGYFVQKFKERYESHREDILQYGKDYYQENKEYFTQINKEYYQKNKDNILEQRKEHRKTNKEKIEERENIRKLCSCGSIIKISKVHRHLRSQLHATGIKTKVDEGEVKCICGLVVKSRLARHLNSKMHSNRMEFINSLPNKVIPSIISELSDGVYNSLVPDY